MEIVNKIYHFQTIQIMLKRLVQKVVLIYLVCLSRTQSSEDGEAAEAGGACDLPGCGCEGALLRCSGLNTTAQLRSAQRECLKY